MNNKPINSVQDVRNFLSQYRDDDVFIGMCQTNSGISFGFLHRASDQARTSRTFSLSDLTDTVALKSILDRGCLATKQQAQAAYAADQLIAFMTSTKH